MGLTERYWVFTDRLNGWVDERFPEEDKFKFVILLLVVGVTIKFLLLIDMLFNETSVTHAYMFLFISFVVYGLTFACYMDGGDSDGSEDDYPFDGGGGGIWDLNDIDLDDIEDLSKPAEDNEKELLELVNW